MLIDSLAYGALMAAVFAIPVSNSLLEINSAALIGFAFISLLQSKNARIFKSFFFLLVVLYLGANLLSLSQTQYWGVSLRGIFKVLQQVLLCFSAFYVIDSKEKARGFFFFFLVAAAVVCLDAIFQGITGQDFFSKRATIPYYEDIRRLTGPFKHANDFSAYLSFTVILFLGMVLNGLRFESLRKYLFYLVGAVLSLVCLLRTYSRGAWFSVAIACVFLAVFRKSRVLAAGLILASLWVFFFSPSFVKHRIVSLLQDPTGGTVTERKLLWGEARRMIEASPLFGHGVNTYSSNEPRFKLKGATIDNQYAHNGYLHMAAEIGYLGLLSFLLFLLYFFWKTFSVLRKTKESFLKSVCAALLFGTLSFLIHSATDTDLQSLRLVNMLWLAIGAAWATKGLLEYA